MLIKQLEQAFGFALQEDTFSKAEIARRARHVCVYGLGKYFEDASLRQNIRERFGVTHLCDGNPERREKIRQDKRYEGLSCIAPEEIHLLEDVAVIFMLGDSRQAMEMVRESFPLADWYRLITFNDLILDDIMQARHGKAMQEEKEALLHAFDLLEDDVSREVFANVFCLRVAPHLAQRKYEDICTLPQYFPKDILPLGEDECVVDCGAYIGDTLEEFFRTTGGRFERYDAFEMDRENFLHLEETAGQLSAERIHCHPYGVWSRTGTLSYGRMSSSDSYSLFNSRETSETRVVCLDDAFSKGERITFVKMDIEGAEQAALHGGANVFRKQHPKLAICVYHRMEDLWKIPNHIREISGDYRIYLRHHAEFWVSETVCYGVAGG
ncbi:MAG: FkbM family methyltransferase [Selenomonadaceae bacterium]|nr:FkbM family methyltransferase [Selenomonadaceae bacterium]